MGDSRSCDCKCKFDGPEGFTDHKGGKSAPCDAALNDKDSAACTCTPKTCEATAASCIPEGEMDPMPVEADFKISSFADGCKCEPDAEGMACPGAEEGSGAVSNFVLSAAVAISAALL